jgi:hypothetical protein
LVVPDEEDEGVVEELAPGVAVLEPVGVEPEAVSPPVEAALPEVPEPELPLVPVLAPPLLGLALELVEPLPGELMLPLVLELPDGVAPEPVLPELEVEEPVVEPPLLPAVSLLLRSHPANMTLSNPAARMTFEAFNIVVIVCPFTNVDNLSTLLTKPFQISSQLSPCPCGRSFPFRSESISVSGSYLFF